MPPPSWFIRICEVLSFFSPNRWRIDATGRGIVYLTILRYPTHGFLSLPFVVRLCLRRAHTYADFWRSQHKNFSHADRHPHVLPFASPNVITTLRAVVRRINISTRIVARALLRHDKTDALLLYWINIAPSRNSRGGCKCCRWPGTSRVSRKYYPLTPTAEIIKLKFYILLSTWIWQKTHKNPCVG